MINTFNISALTGLGTHAFKLGQAKRDYLGTPFFMEVKIDGESLPNEPLITISNEKTIVQTTLAGSEREAPVVELISSNNYRLKFDITCLDPKKKEYPYDQVEKIIAMCQSPKPLTIENKLTKMYGIYKIIITGHGFGSMQGKPYSQSYSINAMSYIDFYATLKHQL